MPDFRYQSHGPYINYLVQGIDNGGIHACIHHQGNKGSVDIFSLGQALGDVGQAAGDVDLGKSCLFSGP
ncbi:MAG: hypothetical protein GY860_15855 [Desulfobacteraceae bacterium]|nr:hypothetical protein [Desulfobacteraceae bacterium]